MTAIYQKNFNETCALDFFISNSVNLESTNPPTWHFVALFTSELNQKDRDIGDTADTSYMRWIFENYLESP